MKGARVGTAFASKVALPAGPLWGTAFVLARVRARGLAALDGERGTQMKQQGALKLAVRPAGLGMGPRHAAHRIAELCQGAENSVCCCFLLGYAPQNTNTAQMLAGRSMPQEPTLGQNPTAGQPQWGRTLCWDSRIGAGPAFHHKAFQEELGP